MTSPKPRQADFASAAKKLLGGPQLADPSGRSFLAFMDQILSAQDVDSASGSSFVDCGPETQRIILKEALRGYLQKLNPSATERTVSKLIDDFRLKTFRALCLSKPDRMAGLITGVVTAYLESLMPDVRSTMQRSLKKYLQELRASAELLHETFDALLLFQRLPIAIRLSADDHFMLLRHLEQALASVIYLDAAFDQQFASLPDTRKKAGKRGRQVLFGLLVGELLQQEFGVAQQKIVTELTDVLFDVDSKTYKTGDANAFRSAQKRWKKRRPIIDKNQPVDAAHRVILDD